MKIEIDDDLLGIIREFDNLLTKQSVDLVPEMRQLAFVIAARVNGTVCAESTYEKAMSNVN